MRIAKTFQISLLITLTLIMSSCGRSYHIKGRVITLTELQSVTGFIAEITGKDLPQGGNPVAGAKVRMLHQLDKHDKPITGSDWEHDTATDANGFFDTSDYAAPSSEAKVGLEISKNGYKTVFTTYIDYNKPEPQIFLVMLVPIEQFNNLTIQKTPTE